MRLVLTEHSENIELIHITTQSCLESICHSGIACSEYGDLDINGNDGRGIYALRNPYDHEDLLNELSLLGEPLYLILFKTNGLPWFECTDEILDREDIEDDMKPVHIGYINVLADVIAPENIMSVQLYIPRQKLPLLSQIQFASSLAGAQHKNRAPTYSGLTR